VFLQRQLPVEALVVEVLRSVWSAAIFWPGLILVAWRGCLASLKSRFATFAEHTLVGWGTEALDFVTTGTAAAALPVAVAGL